MPNDNDLDRYAASIRGSIRRGLTGDRVAATLLVDDADAGGLRRVALTRDSVEEEVLDTDDSTDVAAFEAYLDWASETFPARHYALALLGHGGRLDEVAFDLRPEGATEGNARWASAAAVADAIRRWRASLSSGELELLFLLAGAAGEALAAERHPGAARDQPYRSDEDRCERPVALTAPGRSGKCRSNRVVTS